MRMQRVIAICLVMVTITPMPAHALAPQSSFSQDEKKPTAVGVEASPEEQFLEFLEAMRTSLALLNQAQGMHAFGFVVDRKRGFVTILGGGEGGPKALAAIPDHAMRFMRAYDLEELRFPLRGPYLPRLEQAIAKAAPSQPTLLRWVPRLSRRSFLGAMGTSLRILWSRPPTLDSLVESVGVLANPVALKYLPNPLTRGEEMVRAFALDNILTRSGPGGWMPYLPASEDIPISINWSPWPSELERARIQAAAVESLANQHGHYVEIALSLGNTQDVDWILAIRDAILNSRTDAPLRAGMLSRFNALCPEFATPLSALDFWGGTLLDNQKTPYQRWQIDQEFLDLDHLEYEACSQIEGTASSPSFIDVIHNAYVRDLHEIHRAMENLADSNKEAAMWNLLPAEIRRRGGITARGMAQLRRITGIYRKAMRQMTERGEMATQDNCGQIVERLDQTMREAPLKLEVNREGRGVPADVASQYTILDREGRTFKEVLSEYRSEGILRSDIMEEMGMEGWDANDPNTWGVLLTADPNFIITLSKMTTHELAIMLRRVAEEYGGNLGKLARSHRESDMDLLKGFIGLLAATDLPKDRRGHEFVHLIPSQLEWRIRYLNHLNQARQNGKPTQEWGERLRRDESRIALFGEIVRRWVKPEEFDYDSNAIARIVQHNGKAYAISLRMEAVLAGFSQPPIPLDLESGILERPAFYECDADFWDKVEQNNPGTWVRVKIVIATYFDDNLPTARVPLKMGVDYDFVTGRSVVIKLATPVLIHGISMKELILKGAPFKKSEDGQDYHSPYDLMQEDLQTYKQSAGNFEFDPEGAILFKKFIYDRVGAIYFTKTKTEYDIGRDCFHHPKAPITLLPVMNVCYAKDRGRDNLELGVVVHASPIPTVRFPEIPDVLPMKNRIGDLLNLLAIDFQSPKIKHHEAKRTDILNRIARMAYAYGVCLRKFHNAGYMHGNPRANNVLVDMDTMQIQMCDLSDAKSLSAMTEPQAFGYMLKDIHYGTGTWLRALEANKDDPDFVQYGMQVLRYFLAGYFGKDGMHYQTDSDYDILKNTLALDAIMASLRHALHESPVNIVSPMVVENPIAQEVMPIVFGARMGRTLKMSIDQLLGLAEQATEGSL